MLKMNKPEWFFIVAGCFACLINGGIQPSFGIILSELIAVDFLNILF
jgi:presenilin-like A22 family membrane protease